MESQISQISFHESLKSNQIHFCRLAQIAEKCQRQSVRQATQPPSTCYVINRSVRRHRAVWHQQTATALHKWPEKETAWHGATFKRSISVKEICTIAGRSGTIQHVLGGRGDSESNIQIEIWEEKLLHSLCSKSMCSHLFLNETCFHLHFTSGMRTSQCIFVHLQAVVEMHCSLTRIRSSCWRKNDDLQ